MFAGPTYHCWKSYAAAHYFAVLLFKGIYVGSIICGVTLSVFL